MTFSCSTCNKVFPTRSGLKRVRHEWFCSPCYVAGRKARRKLLRSSISLRPRINRDVISKVVSVSKPKPLSIVPLRSDCDKPFLRLALTSSERQFLFGKYVRLGYDIDDVRLKVQRDADFLLSLRKRLVSDYHSKKIDESAVNSKFKEEFAKLLEVKN